MPKLLKLPTNWLISTGVMENTTNGSVILRNCWNGDAPSSEAASYRSGLMLERMPVLMSMIDGMVIQPFTNSPMPRAHHLADSTLDRKKIASCPFWRSSWLIGPLCENMNLNPSMEIKPGIAYARIGNARQSLEPRTLRLFSSSASASPPKKLSEVDNTAQRMFQVRMRPNVSPMEPTPRIFVQAESDQLASRGCTMSPPKSVNAIRIMNTMGRIVKMLTPITGSTRAVTWNLSSAMVASDSRNVCGRCPAATRRAV